MARNRQPGTEPSASCNDIKPDPSRIGGVAEVPFVRLPDPTHLFATRAHRLREVAEGHMMAEFLRFLASVSDAQAAIVADLPTPAPVPPEQRALRAEHAMPPLSEDQVRANPDLLRALDHLLSQVDLRDAPQAARDAAHSVAAMAPGERSALATDIFGGSFPVHLVAESLFVAAALQVHLARLAARLDAKSVIPPAEGICPVCGGAPVSSLIVGWTQANKARYCACSLCGTLWNHVRVKCTSCSSTEGIAYYAIEDGPKTIGVETCSKCHSYIKHMQQHEDTKLDPVADDIASYALDLLAQEQDFRRSSLNPFLLTS